MNQIIIQEVNNQQDLRKFINFPKVLYKDCPYYVPAIDDSEFKTLTQHPALQFCTQKLWIATINNAVVGRIAGIINHKCNSLKGQQRVRFGWFDFINDRQVAESLLSEVIKWGKDNQMNEICGPSRYSNMEKQALLIEGFDCVPPIATDYNFAYYPTIIEELGFIKDVDYVQHRIKIAQVPAKIDNVVQLLSEKYHIHLRKFKNKKELKAIGTQFFKVINESYTSIYNFIPLTDEEIKWVIDENFSVADIDLVSVLENERNEIVGIAFCLPSLSKAFQRAKGKLFPLGWWHILRALKKNNLVDMYLTAVIPEYAHTGIHAIYHQKLNEIFLAKGYEYAYTSQQLEENIAARIWNKYKSELVARRRCYKKDI